MTDWSCVASAITPPINGPRPPPRLIADSKMPSPFPLSAIDRDPLRESTKYIVKKLLKEEDETSARIDTPHRIKTFRCLRRFQYPSGRITDFTIVSPCLVRKETTRSPE